MTYGAQTWVLKERDKNKLQVTRNIMEKGILEIKQNIRIRIEKVKHQLKGNRNV